MQEHYIMLMQMAMIFDTYVAFFLEKRKARTLPPTAKYPIH